MSLVYATAFNIRKCLFSAQIDISGIDMKSIEDAILNKKLHIPNKDYRTIKTMHIFLESPENFMKDFFKGWKDNEEYLIESPPAYHTDSSCEWFRKDFFNVEIPEEIKAKNLVRQAREWAIINNELLTPSKGEEFQKKFVDYFNSSYETTLTIGDVKLANRANSGSVLLVNDLTFVQDRISKILTQYNNKFNSSLQEFYDREFKEQEYSYHDEYKGYDYYIEYKINRDLSYLKRDYLRPLKHSLKDYIFQKLNKDGAYQKNILELLNFKPCKACGKSR